MMKRYAKQKNGIIEFWYRADEVDAEIEKLKTQLAEADALIEAQKREILVLQKMNLVAENERLRTNKWLPMETAPKDGTRIILDWGGRARVGFYLDNIASQVPWQGWRVPSMEDYPRNESPKYWMPMPDTAMEGDG